MTQYNLPTESRKTTSATSTRWMNASAVSAIVGGALLSLTGFALLTVLNEAEFRIVDPLGTIAFVLITLGLPALYASEREWFTRLGRVAFWLFAGGWILTIVTLPVAVVTMPPLSEAFFLGFLVGILTVSIGAIIFGTAILRTKESTAPRLSAWLLILALPVGVPIAAAFTTYVMGQFADPWAGPFVLIGFAWIVLGRHIRRKHTVIGTRATAK